jgi:hypothetical protein
VSISKKDLENKALCEQVVGLYVSEQKPTLKEISKQLPVTFHTAQEMVRRALLEEELRQEKALRYSRSKVGDKNPMTGKTGDRHHMYKGRLFCDPGGYVLVLKPSWYTGRPGSRHIYEHSVVMAEMMGLTETPAGMHIHHIDEDRQNNSPDNLALVSAAGHSALHARSPLRRLSLWELHKSGISKSKPTTATSPTG